MPDALGVCGTLYKVKNEENLFWGVIWLPSQNARTRVRLLYVQYKTFFLELLQICILHWHIKNWSHVLTFGIQKGFRSWTIEYIAPIIAKYIPGPDQCISYLIAKEVSTTLMSQSYFCIAYTDWWAVQYHTAVYRVGESVKNTKAWGKRCQVWNKIFQN